MQLLSSPCPGDFAILLTTGLSWPAALTLNFMHSLTAVVGFFVGVTIGTDAQQTTGWILGATAGVFLYIALVDLVSACVCVCGGGGGGMVF